ncbi:MAG: hypothetical protein U5N56_08345 [Candidatus Marinimicrobia bacterium]|nr:hypothetical protein [Candidatus Neomarinimicrobiota bacterium]
MKPVFPDKHTCVENSKVKMDKMKVIWKEPVISQSDEVISGILNITYAGVQYTVIRDPVQIHPTVSELIPTMLEQIKTLE